MKYLKTDSGVVGGNLGLESLYTGTNAIDIDTVSEHLPPVSFV